MAQAANLASAVALEMAYRGAAEGGLGCSTAGYDGYSGQVTSEY